MLFEEFLKILWRFYRKTNMFWFTAEGLLVYIWQVEGKPVSYYTVKRKLEQAVKKGIVRKHYVKRINEWGLPVRKVKYSIDVRRLREVVVGR